MNLQKKKTKISKGVGLNRDELAFVIEARKFLELANFKIYVWCDLMGYELWEEDFRDMNTNAIFIRTNKKAVICLNRRLLYKRKILNIAHEIFHDRFHPDCIAFRVLTDEQIGKDEGQAHLFSALILYPELTDFETEEDFLQESGLPTETAEIRINYYRKTGT